MNLAVLFCTAAFLSINSSNYNNKNNIKMKASSSSGMPMIVDIVTGSTQGIGKAVAEYIAHERCSASSKSTGIIDLEKYYLVLVGRNEQRGQQVKKAIQQECPLLLKNCVIFESCDLSDWKSVQQLQQRIATQLTNSNYQIGILVNGAAECPKRQQFVQREQKEKGMISLDKQFATNVLGYHFMMKAFQDHFFMASSIPANDDKNVIPTTTSHIVNVASTWAGDLDLKDINFQRRRYDNDSAYRQSKQCDRMLNKIWSLHLQGKALANACHPGDPCTTLSKDLGYNMFAGAPTRSQIARGSPFPYLCGLLKDKSLTTTGGWFVGTSTTPSSCRFGQMSQDAERLFELCESFCI